MYKKTRLEPHDYWRQNHDYWLKMNLLPILNKSMNLSKSNEYIYNEIISLTNKYLHSCTAQNNKSQVRVDLDRVTRRNTAQISVSADLKTCRTILTWIRRTW